MTELSIRQSSQSNQSSPFDSIRGFRADGSEYWTARELTKWLGYSKWQNAEKAIKRSIKSLENQGYNTLDHVTEVSKDSRSNGLGVLKVIDYELSRLGCYTIAMNSDPEKEMVAMAQGYFATQTRKAEVIIPKISEDLEMMKLQNANLKMQLELQARQDARISLHGLATTLLLEGKSNAVVEVDKPTIEVIDHRNNTRYEGQTLTQVKEYLAKKHGIRYRTAAEIERVLEKLGLSHLLAQTPRSILSNYIPTENQQAVYDALTSQSRQMLLGES